MERPRRRARKRGYGVQTVRRVEALQYHVHVSYSPLHTLPDIPVVPSPVVLTASASFDSRRELSRRIETDPELSSVAVLAVDPGAMLTDLSRRNPSILLRAASTLVRGVNYVAGPLLDALSRRSPNADFRSTAQSASDIINAAFDTEKLGEHPNGVYMNGSVVGEVGPEAKDAAKCRKVWEDCLRLAQIGERDTVLADWR